MNTHPVFVFSASICPEPFDQFSSFLCFHFGLEFLELCQHACQGLLLQWIDVRHPGKIVDKEGIVLGATICRWIYRSTQIAVDKFERLLGPRCQLVGRLPVLLSFQVGSLPSKLPLIPQFRAPSVSSRNLCTDVFTSSTVTAPTASAF